MSNVTNVSKDRMTAYSVTVKLEIAAVSRDVAEEVASFVVGEIRSTQSSEMRYDGKFEICSVDDDSIPVCPHGGGSVDDCNLCKYGPLPEGYIS